MAKYIKGTFVVIPNKEKLYGLDAGAQTIFFWLCAYADQYGICFPSRKTIAEASGLSIKSVDRRIKILEDQGFIERRRRMDEKNYQSNEYTINIMDTETPPEASVTPGRDCVTLPLGTESTHYLNPVLTKTTQLDRISLTPKQRYMKGVLDCWNEKGIISHKTMPLKAEFELGRLFQASYPLEDIQAAITTYATVLHGEDYLWSYKWNLYEFIKRGLQKFEGKKPEDYLIKKESYHKSKVDTF